MADVIRGPSGYQGVLANMARRGSAKDLGDALLNFQADTEDAVDLIMRGVGQWALREVIRRSPVGQPEIWQSVIDSKYLGTYGTKAEHFAFARKGYVGGRFKGNWQVATERPAEGVVDKVDPSGAETLQAGTATLNAAERPREVWLTNNLPYSERLENGWSSQAPRGMVAVTMADIGTAFEQQAAEALGEKGLA